MNVSISKLMEDIENYLGCEHLKDQNAAFGLLVRSLIALETLDNAMATLSSSLLSTLCEDHLDLAEDSQGLIQFNSDLKDLGELECPRCTEENLRLLLDLIHQGPYDSPSLTESTEEAAAIVKHFWRYN